MKTLGIPAITDQNGWADFWYYQIGVNVIPAHTQKKKTFVEWKRWQIESIPEELHDQWKRENKFADGLAIILGKVWRGEHRDEYFIFIDLDNSRAIDDFRLLFPADDDGESNECRTLKELADKFFIVEQHPDDTSKAHVFFYSKIHFTKKSSDANAVEDTSKFNTDEIPAFEVKGLGTHGIAYCTPSVHKNGQRYQIIGTTNPMTLTEVQATTMMEFLDGICQNYGLHYLEYDDGNGKSLTPVSDLFRDEYVIVAGNNRHEALLRVKESLIRRNYGILKNPDEIKEIAYKWNQNHCKPPLEDKEFKKQWKDAAKFIIPQIESEGEEDRSRSSYSSEEHQQQVQAPQQELALTEELTKEVSWDEIASILSTSIKKDDAPKLITFNGMLLAQTNDDQLTVGFQAESSAGKSYIPLEVCLYFPKSEVDEIASASPTAFYHDSINSKWDPKKKAIVLDLEHKIIIFMDMPHWQLMEKLRPIISHDRKELKYKITDKSKKHGLQTKNVIIRGHASFYFCSTNADPDEQEKTRMVQLSPSTDEDKLKETLLLLALRKSNPAEYNRRMESDKGRVWLVNRINAIRQGAIREIIVPDDGKAVYDRFIKEHQHLQPRHQRDLPRIFSFIKAHALLNCFNRKKQEGKSDTIIANEADINAGFALYKHIEQANELGLSPYLFGIYSDVIKPMLEESYYREDGEGLKNKDIMRKYYQVRHKPISPKKLKECLEQLEAVGLIRLDIVKDGDKRQKLVYATVLSKISGDKEK